MARPEPPWTDIVSLAVHEMRSPVSVISGFTALLIGGHGGTLSPAQRQALEAVNQASSRLAALLSDLSELGRLRSGRLVPAEERFPVSELLRDAAARFVAPLDVPVTCHVDADSPEAYVLGDKPRLAKALAAMAAFVSRSAPTAPTVILKAILWGDWVAITVTDDASVVSPEDLGDLAPLPETQGGTGLGLPLGRALLDHAGGVAGIPRSGASGGQLAVLLPVR